ncbi:hypothetical protein E1B28_004319 [Marasmius oreades]|uniref:Origin recognition complex subunit 4 n=1 Tax=Marasmius oreades TaxID=181124 RepID=A0A9P8AD34_9AGAR|nr:uncharacterized protein E1B28_004319 [Marasmius oreades]KAG7096915.1 hypothetical protein E1B28_004319 [Marasmius oreades]
MPPNRKAESLSAPQRITRSAARAQDLQPSTRVTTATTRTARSTRRNISEQDGEESEDELNLVPNSTKLPKTTRSVSKSPRQPTKAKQVNVVIPTKPETTCTRARKRAAKEVSVSQEVIHDEPGEYTRKRRKLASPEPEEHSVSSTRASSPMQVQSSQPTATILRAPQKSITNNLLPSEISTALLAQKRAVLHKLQHPSSIGGSLQEASLENTNDLAAKQVADILEGSVFRGEGNSCMILGPRGSGKTQIIERCIVALPEPPIVVRLSGWLQYNDRLAIQEMAYQLSQQGATQFSFVAEEEPTAVDDEDPFVEGRSQDAVTDFSLPVAYLHTLISCIPTLSRPTVLILDAFDLFTFHPRQSLLYSLLDTVQSCRAGAGNKGMAVIGLTTRMDTLNLFEKRVKSRFSGRMIRTASPKLSTDWLRIAKDMLLPSAKDYPELTEVAAFQTLWQRRVDDFLSQGKTIQIFEETFTLVRDIRVLSRLLTFAVLKLSATSPWLTPALLEKAAESQRMRVPFPQLPSTYYLSEPNVSMINDEAKGMSYPSLCLLVASVRAENLGYPALTFEMLHTIVRDEIRGSNSAPVQLNGMSIGMHKVSRPILMCAFEHMMSARIFVVSAPVFAYTAPEFVKYRCAVQRVDVDKAVGSNGQHGLKTWWKKVKGN